MSLGFRNHQRLETTQRVDPKLLLSSQLLQLSQQDLEQLIDTELNENPALERTVFDEEPMTDRMIEKEVVGRELKPRGDDRELWRSLPTDDDTPTWVELASTSISLVDHITAQLMPVLPNHLRHVGEYVLGSLNENGYLYDGVEEIALATSVSIEEVEEVVAALKKCDPAGVGASGVQESIFIQLLNNHTLEGKLARRIVRDHLECVTNRKSLKLARKYSVTLDVVNAAFDLILACTPFPGEGFQRSSALTEGRIVSIQPDLVFTYSEVGWEISVKGPRGAEFLLNNYYKQRLEDIQVSTKSDKEERRHLSHFVTRAKDFMECLEIRHKTMMNVGRYLVENQAGFVSTGDAAFLQPLTRTQMARDLGMHESTISRATQGKFAQLANGEVISFEVFFKPALRIQKMIEEILATENPDNPLSDERIAQILASKGVQVARRTVNKYRDRTKLLSSRKRRSA